MITKTLLTMKMNTTSPTSAQQTAGRLLTLKAKTRKTSQASIQLAFGKFGLEISLIQILNTLMFRDFLLKPELLRAISDLGFEHPSEGETTHFPMLAIIDTYLPMLNSSTRMYSASRSWDGRAVPSQVWTWKDS